MADIPDEEVTYENDRRNGKGVITLGATIIVGSLLGWALLVFAPAMPWQVMTGLVVGTLLVGCGLAQYLAPSPDAPKEADHGGA